jgi:hypothetical protein
MYSTIGCSCIEHVSLKKGVDMWIDEEGLLIDEPLLNHRATALYRAAYKDCVFPKPEELAIFGKAIITDNTKAGEYLQ